VALQMLRGTSPPLDGLLQSLVQDAVHQADGADREASVELGLVEVLHVVGGQVLELPVSQNGLEDRGPPRERVGKHEERGAVAAHGRALPADRIAVEGRLPRVVVGDWVFDPQDVHLVSSLAMPTLAAAGEENVRELVQEGPGDLTPTGGSCTAWKRTQRKRARIFPDPLHWPIRRGMDSPLDLPWRPGTLSLCIPLRRPSTALTSRGKLY
jgi:hypothetical protein